MEVEKLPSEAPKRCVPASMFHAVACDDIEGMVRLFAMAAKDAMGDYLRMRKRYGGSRVGYVGGAPRWSSRAEEKHEDFCAQDGRARRGGMDGIAEQRRLDAYREAGNFEVAEDAMECVTFNINTLQSIIEGSLDSKMEECDGTMKDDERTTPRPPKQERRRREADARGSLLDTGCDNGGISEADRLGWESARLMSNSRPSSSFVLYNNEVSEQKQLRRSRRPNSASAEYKSVDAEAEDGPPLFDGSVANATPGTSGLGSALHLACVTDSPFALAVLLAMGADASSRNTAFRRLMVHEAACADSPGCLELLMAMGKHYAESAVQPCSCSASEGPPSSSGSLLDTSFGFLSSWVGTGSGPENSADIAMQSVASAAKTEAEDDDKTNKEHVSFAETLQFILQLASSVRSGEMGDIEAATTLITRLDVSPSSRVALASACSAVKIPTAPFFSSAHRLPGNLATLIPPGPHTSGNADGHGNTPLHWASFKNSAACVAVLLAFGADPNARAETSGWTPLHDAAYSDASDSLALLIAAGADVDSRANSGATPLCFAAQEDAPKATRILLQAGADAAARCCSTRAAADRTPAQPDANATQHSSRFSGYTPLHYCAHYNAYKAAKVLLEHNSGVGRCEPSLLEVADLNQKLPIHIAVQRGSSDVLRELLKGGARIEIGEADSSTPAAPPPPPTDDQTQQTDVTTENRIVVAGHDGAIVQEAGRAPALGVSESPTSVASVSSPVLRSLLPSRPVMSSKPWNCLSQASIDECRDLIREAELNWAPERHELFHPQDRRAVLELLRVGKRLEQLGTGIYIRDIWPYVLSFCGRGWFEPELKVITSQPNESTTKDGDEMNISTGVDASNSSGEASSLPPAIDVDSGFMQFRLDE